LLTHSTNSENAFPTILRTINVNIRQQLLMWPGPKFSLDAFQHTAGHFISTLPACMLPPARSAYGDKSHTPLAPSETPDLLC